MTKHDVVQKAIHDKGVVNGVLSAKKIECLEESEPHFQNSRDSFNVLSHGFKFIGESHDRFVG